MASKKLVITDIKFKLSVEKERKELQKLILETWKMDRCDSISLPYNIKEGDEFPAYCASEKLRKFYDFEIVEGEPVIDLYRGIPSQEQVDEAKEWHENLSRKEKQLIEILMWRHDELMMPIDE